jgi:fructose-1,6-bisphosphatase/inositol monophosphatase family enzyme
MPAPQTTISARALGIDEVYCPPRRRSGRMAPMAGGAERFLEVFRLAAWQAGAVARRLQGRVEAGIKEGQSSPEAAALSSADLATQDVLLLALRDALPDTAVDAEEETELAGAFPAEGSGRSVVVVDPIDGSFGYLRGSPDYAVMAGWLEGNAYRAALAYFPAWDETYWALQGAGCWRRRGGGEAEKIVVGEGGARLLVPPGLPESTRRALATTGLELVVNRCSAVDGVAPLAGRAAASIAWGGPDRRRGIALFLALTAGATVRVGSQPWDGEDPVQAPAADGPTIAAAGAQRAGKLLRLFTRGQAAAELQAAR